MKGVDIVREIMFRGKRIDNGEWVHGDLVQIENDAYIYDYDIGDNGVSDTPRLSQIKWQVDPATVGQFTGFPDKNGREIYEGDIVMYPWNYQDYVGTDAVRWDSETTGFTPFNQHFYDAGPLMDSDKCEVIGNIHDNPELLEA